ncbi:MAG: hypothetical protein U9Q79_03415 [Candidatus Hydrogenedentes bacterium]|nr:hypothetical protein [Candidatus Hydrogenedentota bacterium]
MADVNLQLVREFFELNLFAVLTNWQRESLRQRVIDGSLQLFVENMNPSLSHDLDVVLNPVDLCSIERALVEVRAWHAEKFYPSVVESNPVLWQFVSEESLAYARDIFNNRPFKSILVVSELPNSAEPRARSVELLLRAGIDHVLEFSSVLRDLLDKVSMHQNYTASPTLQTLRLLKRYRLVRNQQLEFAFLNDPPIAESAPHVDAVAEVDTLSGDDSDV